MVISQSKTTNKLTNEELTLTKTYFTREGRYRTVIPNRGSQQAFLRLLLIFKKFNKIFKKIFYNNIKKIHIKKLSLLRVRIKSL